MDNDLPILTIGALAKALNVHTRTLRIWDAENVLSPHRTPNNRRLYSLNQLEIAKAIVFMTRKLAFNLASVKILLKIFSDKKLNSDCYLSEIKKLAKKVDIDYSD